MDSPHTIFLCYTSNALTVNGNSNFVSTNSKFLPQGKELTSYTEPSLPIGKVDICLGPPDFQGPPNFIISLKAFKKILGPKNEKYNYWYVVFYG